MSTPCPSTAAGVVNAFHQLSSFELSLSTNSYSHRQQQQQAESARLITAEPSTSTSTPPSVLDSSCYDCRRSFSLPLGYAHPLYCSIPDCIRLFDSGAYLQRQPAAAEAEAAGFEAQAGQAVSAAATMSGSAAEGLSDSAEQHIRHAARHGSGSRQQQQQQQQQQVERQRRDKKQSAEQLKAHIQQFLLDESKEGTLQ